MRTGWVPCGLVLLGLAGCLNLPPADPQGANTSRAGLLALASVQECITGGPAVDANPSSPWGSVDVVGHYPKALGRVYGSAAAWDGSKAWVFGGFRDLGSGQPPQNGNGVPTDTILSYQPGDAEARIHTARLPAPNWDMAAVWADGVAYLFGGQGGHERDVVRFDPSSGQASLLGVKLPERLRFPAAVWDGEVVYIFGVGDSDRILRFNPATETLTPLGARLPTPRQGIMAAFDGTDIFLFGGRHQATNTILPEILRFDRRDQAIHRLPAVLPTPLAHGGVAWDGDRFILMGGVVSPAPNSNWVRSPAILTYEPNALLVRVLPMWLPSAESSIAVVSDGDGLLVFSPFQDTDQSQVWRVRVPAGLPFELGRSNVAWIGKVAYAVGGSVDASAITRYDAATGRAETLAARLPAPRLGATVVPARGNVYVVGGIDPDGQPAKDVVRIGADADVEPLPIQLPQGLACAGATLQEDRLIILGGIRGAEPSDGILTIDLDTLDVKDLTTRLPDRVVAPQVEHDGVDVRLRLDSGRDVVVAL
jgi:hypothetical protein